MQHQIFPKIAKKLNISLNPDYFSKIDSSKIKYHILEDTNDLEKKFPNKFILSQEDLFSLGWEFSRIRRSFRYIKNNFSNDTVILIIIRNPYDLLSSIYCQTIQEMDIINPKKFFYIEKTENIRNDNRFNLYNFDYNELISLYKTYFKKVVVVKYEKLKNLSFLKEIFDVNDDFINDLKITNKEIYNKSISKIGVNSIIFLNRFLNVRKSHKFINSLMKPSDKIINKIRNKILSQFLLIPFFQGKLNKIAPYKKYYINKDYIPIDIDNEISKYDDLDF
tara:strand:- start:124 stop:957 length:834 start_codon:yes stop_codon:yes gene_type:complete